MRAYTPTSSDDELGYFDLVIKVPMATCPDPLESSLSCRMHLGVTLIKCRSSTLRVACDMQVYWKNEHPRFPDGGKMSQCLEALPIGGEMEVKGPLGHMHYLGRNKCGPNPPS